MPPNGWAPGVGIPALSCPCCAVLSRSAPKAAFLDGFLDQVFDIPPDRNQRQSWLCTVDDLESVEPGLDARMHIDDRSRALDGENNRVEPVARWEEGRVGKECVGTCRSRGGTDHSKK